MKLYEVTITAYVAAESYQEAHGAVHYGNVLDLVGCDVEIWEADSVAANWWDKLPFCQDESNEQTCGQFVGAVR